MAYEFVEDSEPEEGFLAGLGRNIATQGFNIGTRALGLPGDILSTFHEYVQNPLSKVLGGEEVPYEETLRGKLLPTTEKHREAIEQFSGDYFKPRNKVEEFVNEVAEDAALLLTPGGAAKAAGRVGKITQQIPKAFLKSLGANVAGDVAEDIGGKTAGDLTKIGSLFLLSFLDTPKVSKELGNLYQKAEAALPENANIRANKLTTNLDNLKSKITKGRPSSNLAPSEKFVVDEIEKIESLIDDGRISIPQAWAQKRSLNETLQKHLYESRGADSKRAKNLAKPLSHFLDETLAEYGKKNPEFYKNLKATDEGFGVLAKSNFISNWIEKNIGHDPLSKGLIHLFVHNIGTGLEATAALPYYAGKVAYRITKSPTLRKLYTQTLSAAAKEDSVSFNKYLKQLDNAIKEEAAEDRYEFIEES